MTISEVGPALESIYKAEIPIRLEWVYDGGYVWVLVRSDPGCYPRTWTDDTLDGLTRTVMQSDAGARAADKGQFLQKDWVERGQAEKLEDAVQALIDAINHNYPGAIK